MCTTIQPPTKERKRINKALNGLNRTSYGFRKISFWFQSPHWNELKIFLFRSRDFNLVTALMSLVAREIEHKVFFVLSIRSLKHWKNRVINQKGIIFTFKKNPGDFLFKDLGRKKLAEIYFSYRNHDLNEVKPGFFFTVTYSYLLYWAACHVCLSKYQCCAEYCLISDLEMTVGSGYECCAFCEGCSQCLCSGHVLRKLTWKTHDGIFPKQSSLALPKVIRGLWASLVCLK